MARYRGWANRLVRLLRRLLRLVGVRRFRQELRAEVFANQLTHFGQRVVGDLRRIGAHVGDQADRAFFTQLDAFIQTLCDHHGALHAEAQFARGVLLKLAGGERGGRTAPALAFVDGADRPVGFLDRRSNPLGFFFVWNRRLLVADADEPGIEGRRLLPLQMSVDGPILFLDEDLDLALALDDQAQGDGLHPPGGETTAHFVPKQRRDLITHQPVKHAAGLLRVHQVGVDVARVLERFLHGALGDLVEGDPANGDRVLLLFLAVDAVTAEFFGQVRSNGLAFAVWVRREIDRVRRLRQLLQLGDDLFLAGDDDVLGREVVVQIDAQRLLGQILNVAERGLDIVTGA